MCYYIYKRKLQHDTLLIQDFITKIINFYKYIIKSIFHNFSLGDENGHDFFY